MLKSLHITNFALINEMEVEFPLGLTVITGETGAGKSIFLEALGLALGNRADTDTLRDKTKKCVIEASFDIKNADSYKFFEKNGLEKTDLILIRREISPQGKSRCFINDEFVAVSVLKELSTLLIDIHSQHQTLLLSEANFQIAFVDAVSNNEALLKEYKQEFLLLGKLKKELEIVSDKQNQAAKENDYHSFLLNEFLEIDISVGCLKTLEEKSSVLENSELIKAGLHHSAEIINYPETGILKQLQQLKQQLQAISKYNQAILKIHDRVNSLIIELKDVEREVSGLADDTEYDKNELDELNFKLDKINRLLKKHNVVNDTDLLQVKLELEQKTNSLELLEKQIKQLIVEINLSEKKCVQLSEKLSIKRKESIPLIEKEITALLKELMMPNAIFKIELQKLNLLTNTGSDEITFLFSANKGVKINEIGKTASGGEFSRLMLAVKTVLAAHKQLPTIIFDEIDTGVSGEVANKIGAVILQASQHMQVICITHLPQIASKGNYHLFVFKNDDKDSTTSHIKILGKNERILELAKMLSAGNPGNTAIKNAEELLKGN
ncbi:MAG: DNA repair protein RecN [Bacteroidetes bacterium]|nr:DNA repair protein RecN [Bacteroidota bacterium]